MEVESFFPEPTQDALVPRASLLCRMIDKMMGSYVRLSGVEHGASFWAAVPLPALPRKVKVAVTPGSNGFVKIY